MYIIFSMISALASAVSLYSLLCIVRVFFTWVPDLNYSPFGKLLARICDPWLNTFRKFNFTRNSPVDISPVISVGVLIIISSIFKQIARSRSFSPLVILAVIVQMVWSVVSSLLTFFNILLLVRLIAELLDRTQSRIWYSVDQVLNPIIYKIPAFFVRGRFIRPKTAMLITLACGAAVQIGLGLLVKSVLAILLL